MKGDFGSLIWVNDSDGHEYVCVADLEHLNEKEFDNLKDSEKKTCEDVNQFVGTERW